MVALGCQSSRLVSSSLAGAAEYAGMVHSRCGFLVEAAYPRGVPALRHGVMEAAYALNYRRPPPAGAAGAPPVAPRPAVSVDVAFTATSGCDGTLLVGSSRQDCAVQDADAATVDHMLERAAAFLPSGSSVRLADAAGRRVRCASRPASRRERPIIGRVPGVDGLLLAAGHEGSGLTMSLPTAEIVAGLLELAAPHALQSAFAW